MLAIGLVPVTQEATESLDLPLEGDRYLHWGFEGTVTEPELPDPRGRRDREATAPAGGGRLNSRGRHRAVRDCIKLPQFQDHCRRPLPAAHVPSKGTRRVEGHCCEMVDMRERRERGPSRHFTAGSR
ncbi:hypothetical protein EOD39_20755 [Acipenser ruthenus]|uniref:Uncharacterized protein n=1 Tax=Acipenser ruthenus TaxID=7906 RepID=A0A444UUQ0_ACIRT|nr:hypothetical protein EOD39_20755 [Acipenser ruthenus]